MTNKLVICSVSGVEPTTANLPVGKLGVNTADHRIFVNTGSEIVEISADKLTVPITLKIGDVSKSFDGSASLDWEILDLGGVPAGVPLPWFTDVPPDGYAIMKGQAFSTVMYPKLGSVWTDGILPDMRGAGLMGKRDSETIATYADGEVKSHGHSGSVSSTDLGTKTTSYDGDHTHNVKGTNADDLNPGPYLITSDTSAGDYVTADTALAAGGHTHYMILGSHAHTVTIAAYGGTYNTINHWKVNWIVRLA